jgi:ParB family chromosome partitioning protein
MFVDLCPSVVAAVTVCAYRNDPLVAATVFRCSRSCPVSRETIFFLNHFSAAKVGELSGVFPKYDLSPRPEGRPSGTRTQFLSKTSRRISMPKQKTEKPRHLGRGLESLLSPIISHPTSRNQAATVPFDESKSLSEKHLHSQLVEISIDTISPNPYQARTTWNEQELADLAESIKANGVIQPIIVRPVGPGYQLIAGERRLRAARLAALATVPALVRQATDEELLEIALVENIHRADLNPIERARAYQNYVSTFSLTQAEAAARLGEDRSVIANYLRLLDLPDEIKQMLTDGQLTMGHARAILALPTDELRRKLANRALVGRLSVREVERLVRRYLAGSGQTATTSRSKPAHILDLENRLCSQLGTKVIIETRKNGQRGRIIIEFHSLDEFDSITDRLGLTALEQV